MLNFNEFVIQPLQICYIDKKNQKDVDHSNREDLHVEFFFWNYLLLLNNKDGFYLLPGSQLSFAFIVICMKQGKEI